MTAGRGLGQFAEPARLVLAALRDQPPTVVHLFDAVRALDGPIGPGTFFAAIARLERRAIMTSAAGPDGQTADHRANRADRAERPPSPPIRPPSSN